MISKGLFCMGTLGWSDVGKWKQVGKQFFERNGDVVDKVSIT